MAINVTRPVWSKDTAAENLMDIDWTWQRGTNKTTTLSISKQQYCCNVKRVSVLSLTLIDLFKDHYDYPLFLDLLIISCGLHLHIKFAQSSLICRCSNFLSLWVYLGLLHAFLLYKMTIIIDLKSRWRPSESKAPEKLQ